jgi:hypothetical protein
MARYRQVLALDGMAYEDLYARAIMTGAEALNGD